MSDIVKAYPLQWPVSWKRTVDHRRRRANFHTTTREYSSTPGSGSWLKKSGLTINGAVERLRAELKRMGIGDNDIVISTNLKLRLDGLPASGQAQPQDPGVAVYWRERRGERRCMAIDLYDKVEHNLAAVAATLEAMRAIERHGGATILDRAFTGFTALPAPTVGQKPWRQVFGFADDEEVSPLRLEGAYRTARGEAHPDRPSGDHERFLAVQAAYEAGMRELANPA